jgi:ATP-binding cassette, subfamily B, bacterial PglK
MSAPVADMRPVRAVHAVSIRGVLRKAISLLPSTIRRRLGLAAGLSVVLACVEAAAIAGLFSVITVLTDEEAGQPSWSGLVFAENRDQFVARAAVAVLLALIIRSALGFLAAKMQARLHAESDAWLAAKIFERALRYPYASHLRRSSADIISVLSWCAADVSANIVSASASGSVDILMLIALALTLAILQPLIALGMILYFGIVASVLLLGLAPAVRRAAKDEHEAIVFSNRSMMEGLHGVKAFQVAVATDVVAGEHAQHRLRLASARQRKVFLTAMSRQVLETSVTLGIGLLAAALFALQRNGEALASLGLVIAVAFRALPSLSRLLSTLNGFHSASVSLSRIEDELQQPTTHDDGVRQPPLTFERHIDFSDVGFTYESAAIPALEAITVRVPYGSSLGIVGSSGAGKTTLVDLLLGLLEPTGGAIRVDGVALARTNTLAWRRLVGYVPQDVFMLDGSVRDNVAFAGRDVPVSDDQVWDALEQAQLATFVHALPERLDSLIGERGARLSGGQRQRIGIARALYRHPALLVLDEATSSLDLATEASIAATLGSLDRSMTKVIIAHRLTTVRTCEQILFLRQGRVAGLGTYSDLAANVPGFEVLATLSGDAALVNRRTN